MSAGGTDGYGTLDDEGQQFDVAVNDEREYSIWPVGWDLPAGWQRTGFRGAREWGGRPVTG